MTKQEKIREGIEKIARFCEGDCEVCLGEQRMFLHKMGVVIKVERELPLVPQAEIAPMYDKVFRDGVNAGQYNMLKAGYVAVEPLIEGEK